MNTSVDWFIFQKQWLCHDMTEKLLTGMLSHKSYRMENHLGLNENFHFDIFRFVCDFFSILDKTGNSLFQM